MEEKETDVGENVKSCSCNSLSATTLVDDLEYIYENSNASRVFTEEGLS